MSEFGIKLRFDNEEVNSGLENNKDGFKELTDAIKSFEKTVQVATTSSARNLQQVQSQANSVDKVFRKLVQTIGVAFGTREVLNFGKAAIRAAGDYESLNIAVSTFLKSQEKANKILLETQKFSIKTPFTPEEVNKAAKSLLAFGVEQDKIIPKLSRIGDISAGTGKNFNELATIYGKARIAGTLYAEDINQLVEAGIPVISEFANQLGISEAQVKKFASEGKLSFNELDKAFESLTSEGGLFFNLMDSQSQSFTGRVSTLQGLFQDFQRTFGEELLPVIKEAIEDGIEFFETLDPERIKDFARQIGNIIKLLREYGPTLLKLAVAYYVINKAVALYTSQITTATGQTVRLTSAMGAKAAVMRVVAIASRALGAALGAIGIFALIQGITYLIQNWEKVTDVMKGVTAAQRAAITVSKDLEKQYLSESREIGKLFNVLRDLNATKKEQREAIDELREKYPEILAKYDLEKGSLEEIATAQRDVNKAILEGVRARLTDKVADSSAEKQLELQQKLNELNEKSSKDFLFGENQRQKAIESTTKKLEKERGVLSSQLKAISKLELDLGENIVSGNEKVRSKVIADREAFYKKVVKLSTDELKVYQTNSTLEKKIINEILAERRNAASNNVQMTKEQQKAYEDYLKTLQSVRDEVTNLQRANELAITEASEGPIARIAKEGDFALEDLRKQRDLLLSMYVKGSEEYMALAEAFDDAEIALMNETNTKILKASEKADKEQLAQDQQAIQERIKLSNEELTLKQKALEAELAAGNLSTERIREINEEQLLLQEEALERELKIYEKGTQEYKLAQANLLVVQGQITKLRVDNKLQEIDELENMSLQEIERQLKYGDLSYKQTQQLEQQRLKLLIEFAQKRLALLDPNSAEAKALKGTLDDLKAEFNAFGAELVPQLQSFSDLFSGILVDAFSLNDEDAKIIAEGFGQLKGIISDVINSGYEEEINQIDNLIKRRNDNISRLESDLEREAQLKEEGFANNYEALEEQLATERELLRQEEERRYEVQKQQLKNQALIDSAQQAGALAVAVANIIRDSSKFGIAGIVAGGIAVASMFGIYKRYKAQVAGLAQPDVSLFGGGAISDYMEPGQTPTSDRPSRGGKGKGHRIQGTNILVGGDEYLVNGITSGRHRTFLDILNSGKLDHFNLTHMVNTPYERPDLEVLVQKVESADRKEKEGNRMAEMAALKQIHKEVMSEVFGEQNRLLSELDERRPVIIPRKDGVEEVYYTKSGIKKKRIRME